MRGVTLDGQPATCSFHYRIIAKRLGYEDTRLAPAQDPATTIEQAPAEWMTQPTEAEPLPRPGEVDP